MRKIAKYLNTFKITLLTSLAYFHDFLSRQVFLVVIMFVFVQLWRTTYRWEGSSTIAGFSLAQMIWYLALSESLVMGMPRSAADIDSEVKSGSLAYTLTKPYRYPWFHYARYMSDALVRFFANLLVAGGVTWVMVGPPAFTVVSFAAGLSCVLVAYTLDFWVQFSLGILAFWTEDTWAFRFIYNRVTMLLGGMMLPLEVFPGWLRRIADALPTSQIVYGPVITFLRLRGDGLVGTLVRQGVWITLFYCIGTLLYGMGVKRLSVQGG